LTPERGLIEIGRIARAHGIAGAVKVALHWSGSDALDKATRVVVEGRDGATEREVQWVRGSPKNLLVKFAGVDSRNAAEALHGAKLLVRRDELPSLAPGEFYLVDLVGAEVLGPSGVLGQVVEILVHPTVESIVVETPGGARYEQALSAPWVRHIDAGAKRIELESTDGWIEV
jgi:16S rRNA processing protein RimM